MRDRLEITMKSGTTISVDIETWTVKRNPLSGEFTSLEWVTPEGAKRRLVSINLSDIDLIVECK